MNINIHNIFKSAAVLAMSAFAFASCMQMEGDVNEAMGYLCAPAFEVDVTVEDLIGTKAIEGFVVEEPYPSDFRYVVKDKDDAVRYDAVGLWEPMAMPAGKYSVEAYHGTNGFGEPYFYGKTPEDAQIAAVQQNRPELKVQVYNALVKVSVDSDFARHFTLNSVVLTSEGVSKTFTADGIADWCFVPSGSELSIRLIGESKAGVAKEFTHVITPAPKSANDIVCRQDGSNLPSITLPDQAAGAWATRLYINPLAAGDFTNISADNQRKLVYEVIPEGGDWETDLCPVEQIEGRYYVAKGLTNGSRYTVRARIGNLTAEQTVEVKENLEGVTVKSEHYKDGNGNLAGTNSTLSVPTLPGILGTLNDPEVGLLQITGYSLSNGSETVRTASAAGLMTAASGWPYLPQGSSYVLTISHKLSNDPETVESKNIGINSPSPKDFLGISLTSYSSYDKYLENNPDAANAMDAFTIKTLGATWTVAPDLMNNAHYSKSFAYNNNGQSVSDYSGNICSLGDKGQLAVGTQYNVSASLTFDGEKVETGSRTHYITGLPYVGDFSDANKDANWGQTKEGTSSITFAGSYVRLQPGRAGISTAHATLTSKQSFILPSNVNVHFYNVMRKSGGLLSGYKLLFGSETITSINSSVTVDESKNFSSGTYNVVLDSTYGSSNRTSYYEVSSLIVNYGSLN